MIEWRYWRWQALRQVPLSIALFVAVSGGGFALLQHLPDQFTAQSRLVLETPLALGNTPKAARSAQDIQHLQVVMHQLIAGSGPLEDTLDLTVQSGRDKPTFLSVTSRSGDSSKAEDMARTTAGDAIRISNALQRERIDASLEKLAELEHAQSKQLAAIKAQALAVSEENTYDSVALSAKLEALNSQRDTANRTSQQHSPELAKLHQSLAQAAILFSDQHPKIKVLRAQIANADRPRALYDLAAIDAEILQTTKELRIANQDQKATDARKAELSALTVSHKRSQDALIQARLKGEESFARLKLVQDAHVEAALPANKRLALQIVLLAFALALAIGIAITRIRVDRRIRRPADLASGLGITPFATLPDLGPSLA